MTYWPQVVDALEALWTSNESLLVASGQRPYDPPGDYLIVAWDADPGQMDVGSVSFERSSVGNTWLSESGSVRCVLVCQDGAGPVRDIRDRLFDLLGTLASAVAADQTLGVLPAGSTATVAADVGGSLGGNGLAQSLDLIVTYTTPF